MKNKTLIYVIAIIMILSSYFMVFFWGRSSVKPPPPVVITQPETTYVIKWKPLTQKDDTIIVSEKETVFVHVDSPLRIKQFINEIPIKIGKKSYAVSIGEAFYYRGIAYQDSVWTIPAPFEIELPKEPKPFPVRPYVWVNADYLMATSNTNAHLRFSSEIGFSYMGKFDLHLVASWDQDISAGVGIRYWLLK